jgi:hypothetical protein
MVNVCTLAGHVHARGLHSYLRHHGNLGSIALMQYWHTQDTHAPS